MPFTEDFNAFFQINDFATTATVGTEQVDGILDSEYVEVYEIQGVAPVFYCMASEVSSVDDGDSYIINGSTYYQIKQEPDGTGLTRVILRAA